jgi:NADPH-dependent 2,4-dienoyl-CoA reductase/sulfur reductase-like enzyme
MKRQQCDVLVVGAGPAGMAAAWCAARCGRAVLLADENSGLGGQIWRAEASAAPRAVRQWLKRLASSGVEILAGAAAFEADAGQKQVRFEREFEPLEVRYGRLILATGARELFLPFPGWTRPGIVGAGGIQALIKGGFTVTGRQAVVAGTGPLLIAAAALLKRHGADVVGILEQTSWERFSRFSMGLWKYPGKLLQAAGLVVGKRGVPLQTGWWLVGSGNDTPLEPDRLEWVEITNGDKVAKVWCDLLAYGYGLRPNTELAALLGCRVARGAVVVDELQRTSRDGVLAAGELTGIGGAELSLVEGHIAGYAAADQPRRARAHFAARARQRRFAAELERAFELREELKSAVTEDTIVCRCEDVTAGACSGIRSWKEAKMATRCGMGACQGRTCGAAAEFLYGWRVDSVRPPIVPVRVGTLAGERDRD